MKKPDAMMFELLSSKEWRSLAVMLLWTAGFLAVARLGFRWQGA